MPIYETNPKPLRSLLEDAKGGDMQLPEFQRSWVWDEDRIKSLIASVSQAFPIGAIMTLKTGGDVRFKERPIEGAPIPADHPAAYLLLDGQQRVTSLYQACYHNAAIETRTARHQKVKRWFYIDIRKSLDSTEDREEAIVGVPENRVLLTNFGRDVKLDLSSDSQEYAERMFPVCRIFEFDDWGRRYFEYWLLETDKDTALRENKRFEQFRKLVLANFTTYHVPAITMPKETPREAVCLVFEKVNTGGKPLDVFELVTATYAADGFDLRQDWLGSEGRQKSLAAFGRAAGRDHGLLKLVSSTDFLQAICLVATYKRRIQDLSEGKSERDATPVSATRHSLLRMRVDDYRTYADSVQRAFESTARFLQELHIFRTWDLPYKSQLVPMASIFAILGRRGEESASFRARLERWYWCGVFGEMYGSATESRFARDVVEVPMWLDDESGTDPGTVRDAVFREDRLQRLRTRQSAAYKGMSALLMESGKLQDWRTGKPYDIASFYDDNVDVHHIFPKAWCNRNQIDPGRMNSIVNKTPLSARTNRILGGDAPATYLARLEVGTPEPRDAVTACQLDEYLASHQIEVSHLRTNNFEDFISRRSEKMLGLIEKAMGKLVFRESGQNEPEEDLPEDDVPDDETQSDR